MPAPGSLRARFRERYEQAALRLCRRFPAVNSLLDRVMARESRVLEPLRRPCRVTVRLDPDPAGPVVLSLVPPGVAAPDWTALAESAGVRFLEFLTPDGVAASFPEVELDALERSIAFREALSAALGAERERITVVAACCPSAVTRLLANACRLLGIPFVYAALPAAAPTPGYRAFSPPLADLALCRHEDAPGLIGSGYSPETVRGCASDAELAAALGDICSGVAPVRCRAALMRRILAGEEVTLPVIATNRGKRPDGGWQQEYIGPIFGARRRLWVNDGLDPAEYIGVDALLQWGPDYDYRRKNALTQLLHQVESGFGIPRLILENAFVSSFDIGLVESAKGVIIDDRAPYYHAARESRLLELLNSDWRPGEAQLHEARDCIRTIVANRITKYNHAPRTPVTLEPAERRKILIVDQVFGDASIVYGGGGGKVFAAMLEQALRQPDHDVVLKLHPEATVGGRGTNFTHASLRRACRRTGRDRRSVQVVDYEVNPYSLLDCVDQVFVVTSGMGFEALLAGKDVTCFGMPFYSGWGVTRDMNRSANRTRRRSVEELFYAICVMASRYYRPDRECTVPLGEYLDYFLARLSP